MGNGHKTEQAVIYRIYTEDTDTRPELYELVGKSAEGFTIISAIGFWRGKREQTLIVELIGDYSEKSKVLKLAAEIRALGKQETVLVTTTTGLVNEIN